VAWIVITAYNTAGTILTPFTTTSTSAPNYSIPASGTPYNGTLGSNTGFVASTTAVRVEFTNLPSTNYSGANGTTNATSVQFVTAGASVSASTAHAVAGVSEPFTSSAGVNVLTSAFLNANNDVPTNFDNDNRGIGLKYFFEQGIVVVLANNGHPYCCWQ
jgi:cytoskeletal protein RodZ